MNERLTSIDRTPELAGSIKQLMLDKGLTQSALARLAHVGKGTVSRIINPDEKGGVSGTIFRKVIKELCESDFEISTMLGMAGINPRSIGYVDPFVTTLTREINAFGLTPENRANLERTILSFTSAVGSAMRIAQTGNTNQLEFQIHRSRKHKLLS